MYTAAFTLLFSSPPRHVYRLFVSPNHRCRRSEPIFLAIHLRTFFFLTNDTTWLLAISLDGIFTDHRPSSSVFPRYVLPPDSVECSSLLLGGSHCSAWNFVCPPPPLVKCGKIKNPFYNTNIGCIATKYMTFWNTIELYSYIGSIYI